jgi:hypothetical protein
MSDETVIVYAGKGSSHSWVWLADLLEARGVFHATFADAAGFVHGLDDSPSLAIVSGGDGFEIASALAGKGFNSLREFIGGGGRYLGICAGAYIPLPSRIAPFSELNLSETRIRNIRSRIEDSASPSPRVAVSYGSCSVFHPVRGEVVVGDGTDAVVAPIYGGPIFAEPSTDRAALRYLSFTPKTAFQVERRMAEEVMIGRPAVVTCRYGDGSLILAGPHLEHPGYHVANEYLIRLAGLSGRNCPRSKPVRGTPEAKTLERSLADLKVAVLGTERESFILGAKQWDGSRMLELARAVERRKGSLDDETARAVSALLDRSRETLMSSGRGGAHDSDSVPGRLVEAARLTVDSHFRAARDGFILADNH